MTYTVTRVIQLAFPQRDRLRAVARFCDEGNRNGKRREETQNIARAIETLKLSPESRKFVHRCVLESAEFRASPCTHRIIVACAVIGFPRAGQQVSAVSNILTMKERSLRATPAKIITAGIFNNADNIDSESPRPTFKCQLEQHNHVSLTSPL